MGRGVASWWRVTGGGGTSVEGKGSAAGWQWPDIREQDAAMRRWCCVAGAAIWSHDGVFGAIWALGLRFGPGVPTRPGVPGAGGDLVTPALCSRAWCLPLLWCRSAGQGLPAWGPASHANKGGGRSYGFSCANMTTFLRHVFLIRAECCVPEGSAGECKSVPIA
jgi:hypothetical protein